jgi:hypothetical protein
MGVPTTDRNQERLDAGGSRSLNAKVKVSPAAKTAAESPVVATRAVWSPE